MGIILPHAPLSEETRVRLSDLMSKFEGEVSQCSVHGDSTQIVLNESEISAGRGKAFLEQIIEILGATVWGTDLPIRYPQRAEVPDCYVKYRIAIPYDSEIS